MSCSNIESIDISTNFLDRRIPLQLGGLQNLKILDLSRNQITGWIPTEIGELCVSLVELRLAGNNLLCRRACSWSFSIFRTTMFRVWSRVRYSRSSARSRAWFWATTQPRVRSRVRCCRARSSEWLIWARTVSPVWFRGPLPRCDGTRGASDVEKPRRRRALKVTAPKANRPKPEPFHISFVTTFFHHFLYLIPVICKIQSQHSNPLFL